MATKKSKKPQKNLIRERLVRNKRLSITLNEKEMRLIDSFLEKYKIKNKTKFFRDTIIRTIWQKLDQDAPTLFSEREMR